jgi:hypothetical protein
MASCRNVTSYAYGFCVAQRGRSDAWSQEVHDRLLNALTVRERNLNGNVTIVVRWLLLHSKNMSGEDIAKMVKAHWMGTARLRWSEALSYLRGYLDGGGTWNMDMAGLADLCDLLERVEDTLPKRMQQLIFELLSHMEAVRARQSAAQTTATADGAAASASPDNLDLRALGDALTCDNLDAFPALDLSASISSVPTKPPSSPPCSDQEQEQRDSQEDGEVLV